MLAMAEAECRSILHDFTVQLMKLPKQVGCAYLYRMHKSSISPCLKWMFSDNRESSHCVPS